MDPVSDYTDVGYYIQSVMSNNNWSLRDVANRSKKMLKKPFSYEHLRKITKGDTNPSMDLLERIAKVLGVPAKELQDMQLKSTLNRTFGREMLASMELTPELLELDGLIKLLTPAQRDMIMTSIRAMVQGNAANGTVSMPLRRRRKRPA